MLRLSRRGGDQPSGGVEQDSLGAFVIGQGDLAEAAGV